MKHIVNTIIFLFIISLTACGGGGGGSSSTDNFSDVDGVADSGLDDIGEVRADVLTGTVQYISEFNSYDVNFQIGSSVVVLDSLTVDDDVQIQNMLVFEYPGGALVDDTSDETDDESSSSSLE